MISLRSLFKQLADNVLFDDSNTTIKADNIQEFCEDSDSEITTLDSRVTTTESGINNLREVKADVSYVNYQDGLLDGRITLTESGINRLQTEKADLSYVNEQDISLDTRLTTAETTLQNKADVSTLQSNYYDKSEYLTTSFGSENAGKPIILNNLGYIDSSMLDITAFEYVADWNPSDGAEYPDPSGHSSGAFWIVQGVSGDYTFTGGDLNGVVTNDGDFMVWNGTQWTHINHDVDPNAYYRLDGSQAITADFQAGGHKLTNVGAASGDSDVPRWDQVVPKTGGTFDGWTVFNGGQQTNNHSIRVSNGHIFIQSTTNSSGRRVSFYIDNANDRFNMAVRKSDDSWLKTPMYFNLNNFAFGFLVPVHVQNTSLYIDTGNLVLTKASNPDIHDVFLYISNTNYSAGFAITPEGGTAFTLWAYDGVNDCLNFPRAPRTTHTPSNGSDLTNKTYVDTQDNNLSSRITSNDNDISNLQSNKADKSYVDTQDNNLSSRITSNDNDISNLQSNRIPSGTRMVFYQSSPPTGWSLVDPGNTYMLRVVRSNGGGGGGSHNPILMNVVPSHTHSASGTANANGLHHHTFNIYGGYDSNYPTSHILSEPNHPTQASTNTSDNGEHSHNLSITVASNSGASNWTPRYKDVIICQKD